MMSPVKALFRSRKFVVALFDATVSLILFFVGKYAGFAMEDVTRVILYIQVIFGLVVAGIAFEDGMGKRAGNFPPRWDEPRLNDDD